MRVYRLNAAQAAEFLREGRVDPFTRAPFQEGDEIVVCAREKIAYPVSAWRIENQCPNDSCRCAETTAFVGAAQPLRFQRRRSEAAWIFPSSSAPSMPARRHAWREWPRKAARFFGYATVTLLLLFAFLVCSELTGKPREQGSRASISAGTKQFVSAQVESVNLRMSPGHVGKAMDDVIGRVPTGTPLEILEGPRSADQLSWWRVRCFGVEGWMAERTTSGRVIIVSRQP